MDAVALWKQATVWYCIFLFPMAMLFAYYADVLVMLLFMTDYATAIQFFSAGALILCVFCFDLHLPLRIQAATVTSLLATCLHWW
jgi:hypothetical protein